MKNGNTLPVGLFANFAAMVMKALPRDLPPATAQYWALNGEVLTVVLTKALRTTPLDRVIDCDADPFVPDGCRVEEHKQGGQFTFDRSQIEFYLDDGQKNGKYIMGDKLRERLADKPCLNANVLDYLLANPHLIPDEWKGKYIYFWGTTYRDYDGDLCVRYLHWCRDRWGCDSNLFADEWGRDGPAAVRAS